MAMPKSYNHILLSLAGGLVGVCGCGVVGSRCGPGVGTACVLGTFCKLDAGDCDDPAAIGVCTAIPEACTLEFAPVCGCDGQTYGNECGANSAGVNVDHQGECDDNQARLCGGIQGLICDEGEFCRFDDGVCGEGDQTGFCEVLPEVCPELFAPVCGCDHQSYGNRCEANAAGVSVESEGECGNDIEIRICGGLQGLACEENEYCRFEEEDLCGAADQTGFCEVIPEVCTEEFAPVCGCDDQTYGNDCFAAMAGVSVQAQGECP